MTPQQKQDKLIATYQEMADLTRPECGAKTCGQIGPNRCCDPMYCKETIRYARRRWDTELIPTDHPKLSLMGPDGCTAPPHTRPICTIHTCEVNSIGCKKDDPVWTENYFALRHTIDQLELTFDILQLEDDDSENDEDGTRQKRPFRGRARA